MHIRIAHGLRFEAFAYSYRRERERERVHTHTHVSAAKVVYLTSRN